MKLLNAVLLIFSTIKDIVILILDKLKEKKKQDEIDHVQNVKDQAQKQEDRGDIDAINDSLKF